MIYPLHTKALVAAVILVSVFAPSASAVGFPDNAVVDNDPRELRLAAFQKYLEGDFEGAGQIYAQAINAAETQYGKNSTFVADLCYEVGTISLEDGQFQTAEKYLQLAVKQKPNSVMARVKYADLLAMRGNTGEAFNQIQQALKVSPGSPVAQQAMVKWMMSQSNHKTAEGAIANVAATWESFRLHAMGKNSVQSTIASISSWKNGFLKPPPKVKTAGTVATATIPKVEIKPPAVKVKEVEPPKPKAKVARIKPTERPITAIKPVTAIKPKVEKPKVDLVPDAPAAPEVKVAKIKPPEKRVVVATSAPSKKNKNGFIPPPPPGPVMGVGYSMMAPPPPNGFVLQTTARVKEPDKPEKPKEKKRPKPAASESEEDPDYLLDWASDPKKSKD